MAGWDRQERRGWLAVGGPSLGQAEGGEALGPLASLDQDHSGPEVRPHGGSAYRPGRLERRQASPRGFFLDRYVY